MSPTVILIEDHVTYRESFRLALHSLSNFKVVGEATGARDAFPLLEQLEPDLAVIDFLLPDTNGISLGREVRRRRLRTKTLILGRMAHPLFIRDALRSGIGGFALKQEPLAVILDGLQRVLDGEHYLSPLLQQELEKALASKVPGLARLSAREREILFLLIEGLSSKEIAKSLFLSSKTVDAHRLHINRKLGVRSPAALARLVADQGLIGG
ncbi:MAG TPA: response regulator transcription factor [Polyangia bacterium]